MNDLENLKKKLEAVAAEIAETAARLPAHSVQPPIMQALLALEDERDALIQQIESLQ